MTPPTENGRFELIFGQMVLLFADEDDTILLHARPGGLRNQPGNFLADPARNAEPIHL